MNRLSLMGSANDAAFMQAALQQAHLAARAGEVPVGAVVVRDGQIIGTGANAPIAGNDPSAHAEIIALRSAAAHLGNYRLDDCELFVTLEPCAMCAGAMLHARLKRVVFGAADPKTGACGSVLDLFSNARLNHQTQVTPGILAAECGAVLKEFFGQRREHARLHGSPLREDALRTPDNRFADLGDYPWKAHYVSNLPSLSGLRLHYLDEGPCSAPLSCLCVHGEATWGYVFKDVIPGWLAAGRRVVVPDLIGFGKSDKPKKMAFHRLDWHCQVLLELVERLDLRNVVLVGHDTGTWLAGALRSGREVRFTDVMELNLAVDPSAPAFEAPFPDRGYRAAPSAWSTLRPAARAP